MKNRKGFVSNSSSTSFVISSVEKPKLIVEIDLDAIAWGRASTKDELDDVYLRWYGYKTIEELFELEGSERYNICLDRINRGETVYFIDLDGADSGDIAEPFLRWKHSSVKKNFFDL